VCNLAARNAVTADVHPFLMYACMYGLCVRAYAGLGSGNEWMGEGLLGEIEVAAG